MKLWIQDALVSASWVLHSLVRNTTFDEIVNTAEQIQQQSLLRELSGVTEESLEPA